MKFLSVFLPGILCSVQLFAQCVSEGKVYSFTYGGKTYEVIKEKKTWSNAAACATERGGYLVEINDAAEQAAVHDAIINGAGVSPTYTAVANGGGIAYVWTGATDQTADNLWLWDGDNDAVGSSFWTGQGANGAGNGASFAGGYYNWGGTSTGTPKEPDNYNSVQHHGAIGLTGWPSGTNMLGIAGEWNDIIGSSPLYFVVEKDTVATTGSAAPAGDDPIRVYPNPAHGVLHADFAYQSIEIYEATGKRVKRFEQGSVLDISDLKQQVCIVRITTGQRVTVQKLMLEE